MRTLSPRKIFELFIFFLVITLAFSVWLTSQYGDWSIYYVDKILHFLGGNTAAFLFLWAVSYCMPKNLHDKLFLYPHKQLLIFFTCIWVFIVGVFWEILQHYEPLFGHYGTHSFTDIDTIFDVIFDVLGGLCAATIILKTRA